MRNSSLAAKPPKRGPPTRATSPGGEADIMSLWDSPRQPEAYNWFTSELANLRHGVPVGRRSSDLDTSAAIVVFAAFVGFWSKTMSRYRGLKS